jgi:uncharacterized tellurite resistance protein B-like protein
MLNALKDLLDSLAGPPEPTTAETERAVRLAAAVLLVEVMRAEPTSSAAEREAITSALRERFSFEDDELAQLVALAEKESREAYDFYRFTSVLNERFTQPQKIALVQAMWQVAYADEHLDPSENHLISKIAELLHVTHGEYIAAKLRAKQAAQLS